MALPAPLKSQLEDLELFPDRFERIDALVALGGEFRNRPPSEVPRTAETRVAGCESEVFFVVRPREDGTQDYLFAVDNPQGISAMALARVLESVSGQPKHLVANIDDEVVYQIFGRELSMGKSLGLVNMVRMVRAAALKQS